MKQQLEKAFRETFKEINKVFNTGPYKKAYRAVLEGDNATQRTVFISAFAECIFPEKVIEQGLSAEKAPDGQKGYDWIVDGKRLEWKLTGGAYGSSFTGAAHQDKSDNDGFLLGRYVYDADKNRVTELGVWLTPSFDQMPLTAGRYNDARENVGATSNFCNITIPIEESPLVTPIVGGKVEKRVLLCQTTAIL